jgi:hypothetical protein
MRNKVENNKACESRLLDLTIYKKPNMLNLIKTCSESERAHKNSLVSSLKIQTGHLKWNYHSINSKLNWHLEIALMMYACMF